MSTNPNLPAGAFITSINGRRCTAVPRAVAAGAPAGEGEQEQQQTAVPTNQQQVAQTTLQTSIIQDQPQETAVASASTENSNPPPSQEQAPPPPPPQVTAQPQPDQSAQVPSQDTPPQNEVEQFQDEVVQEQDVQQEEDDQQPVVVAPVAGGFSQIPDDVGGAQDGVGGGDQDTQTLAPGNSNSILATGVPGDSQNEASQTNPEETALTDVVAQATDAAIDVESENEVEDTNQDAGNVLITTIGTAQPTSPDATVQAGQGQPTVTAIANESNSNTENTIAIVGGVVGGVAIASLIAFLLWFWRKKSQKKARRSTLLTPLSTEPSFIKGEKNYVIDRRSLGPTPRSEKLHAAFNYKLSSVRGRLSTFLGRRGSDASAPSVNLNRGNSQFIETPPQHSRSSSRGSSRAGLRGGKLTTKDRFLDWWDRLTEDVDFNWKVRNEVGNGPAMDPFTAARSVREKNAALVGSGQPDFLTLLGMDDKQLEREASLRRQEINHAQSASTSSAPQPGQHFLGGLGLDFDGRDPFGDPNGPRQSAKPAPLIVSQPGNPFADPSAPAMPQRTMSKPKTYVNDLRRSRGGSVGGGPTAGVMGMGIGVTASMRQSNIDSVYRESLQSVDSFATRRNKFRSDPFDLEQPELLAMQGDNSVTGSIIDEFETREDIRRPGNAHTRSESFSSKYTSGVSLGDWAEPGPDVGPAANRWDEPGRTSPGGWSDMMAKSGQSQRSVGKAL